MIQVKIDRPKFFPRHWQCCRRPGKEDEEDGGGFRGFDTVDDDEPSFDLPLLPIHPPLHEIESLRRRHEGLSQQVGRIEHPPIACGIVRNLKLLGIFPACRWLIDPTMAPDVKELFGGSPFFPLGEYRVADFDLRDASGNIHALTIVVNTGVKGMEASFWGAVFEQGGSHHCWARFSTTGPNETTVTEEPRSEKQGGEEETKSKSKRSPFEEYDCLEFDNDYFQGTGSPGKCSTQLERILGLLAEFLLEGLDWNTWLPDDLLEVRDRSSKLERRKRAINLSKGRAYQY